MKRLLSLLLNAAFLVCSLPAFALTRTESEAEYNSIIVELEGYLQSTEHDAKLLSAIVARLDELGIYGNAYPLKKYVSVLMYIEDEDYGNWQIEPSLSALEVNEAFVGFLEESRKMSPIGRIGELRSYYEGRKAESEGRAEDAIRAYTACIGFFDSGIRADSLSAAAFETVYQQACAKMEKGEMEEAYRLLKQCPGYKDSDFIMTGIVRMLGYDPDHAHEWAAATCTSPKTCKVCGATEGSVLGHDWKAATCTSPKACIRCGMTEGSVSGHSWRAATCTSPKTCTVCGVTEGKALGHSWRAATYTAPETCMNCGATRGVPVPTPVPYKAGDIVTFGTYGGKAIEWQVLEVKNDGSCVMTSRYGLDAKPYNTKYIAVTWEICTLRSWLNGEFLNTAFTAEERAKLVKTRVSNPKNSKYGTKGGNATDDYVWLLSIDEAKKYFSSNNARICYPTAYAKKNGAYTNYAGACRWWLRSPGYSQGIAALVSTFGYVNYYGYNVNFTNEFVRPVVCVRL